MEKLNNDNPKREYMSPEITCTLIELESGIAAGSAVLSAGDSGTPDTPQAEDWQSGGSFNKDNDI